VDEEIDYIASDSDDDEMEIWCTEKNESIPYEMSDTELPSIDLGESDEEVDECLVVEGPINRTHCKYCRDYTHYVGLGKHCSYCHLATCSRFK
jgi:hypothetical protein